MIVAGRILEETDPSLDFFSREAVLATMERHMLLCKYRFYRDYTDAENPSSWVITSIEYAQFKQDEGMPHKESLNR